MNNNISGKLYQRTFYRQNLVIVSLEMMEDNMPYNGRYL